MKMNCWEPQSEHLTSGKRVQDIHWTGNRVGPSNVLGIWLYTELCALSRKGSWILQHLNWSDSETDRQIDLLKSIGATVPKGVEWHILGPYWVPGHAGVRRHMVGLYWVPVHAGVRRQRNCRLTRNGPFYSQFVGPEPSLGVSRQNLKIEDKTLVG
jgi:hypothetical protein